MSAGKKTGNILLDALPQADRERLAASWEPVSLSAGQILQPSGVPIRDAAFPIDSIVMKLYTLEQGTSAELAVIGNDGMVGTAIFLGGGRALPNEVRVQRGGQAIRLAAPVLQDEFNRRGAMMKVLLCHTQALIAQVMQTAAANRHGTLEQRFCRWVLTSLDRSPDNELAMTHEAIANLLGVRREGVSEVASRLQRLGALRYHRGHITVLDRQVLELRACEYYRVLRQEIEPRPPD